MTMAGKHEITRFTLYGEQSGEVVPEFLHMERIFDRSGPLDWTIDAHAHPGLVQILLMEEGEALLTSERGRDQVRAPGVFVVPPGAVHAFRFSPGAEGWVFSFAAALLNDPRLAGLCDGLALPAEAARWVALASDGADEQRLRWLLADLDRRIAEGRGATAAVLAQVMLVLASVGEAVDRAGEIAQRSDPSAHLAQRFRALVEIHYRQHWGVADYAAALGTTRATLTRACQAAFGKAPASLCHDRLVLEARRYLAFTGAPVANVAETLGFADPAYFARFFKARTGITASAFREGAGPS